MIYHSVLCGKMLLFLPCLILSELIQDVTLALEDENEMDRPSKPVVHASLITLNSMGNNCALTATNKKYPLKYKTGEGSSYQHVVGCTEVEDVEKVLWQVVLHSIDDTIFDPKFVFPIKNGDKINLLSWTEKRYLNSHSVAAPMSKRLYEVTGYINHDVGMEAELKWEVILPAQENVWLVDMEGVQIRHVKTGKLLTVTDKTYPDEDWGQGMREVAGANPRVGNNKWKVEFNRVPNYVETLSKGVVEELYNNGTSELTMNSDSLRNNTSSSIADLKILHGREKGLLKIFEVFTSDMEMIKLQLEEDGYSISSILNSDVYNPIDSYNLIKRTSRTWPKIRKLLDEEKWERKIIEEIDLTLGEFPKWEHSRIASALGLVNIQIYYDLDPADLINGIVKDNLKNVTYTAETKLSVGDAKLIAQVAEEEESHFSSAIKWLALFPQLRKRYKKLVTLHNDLLAYHPDVAVTKEIFTFNETVDESLPSKTQISELLEKGRSMCPPFQGDDAGCVGSCIPYYYFPEIKSLCQGDKTLRPASKDVDTKCELLTFANPYLRLGPFLMEHSNKEGNYVGVVHSLLSETEMDEIKNKTKGQMKATPYNIANTQLLFSYKRTSKVKYISERSDELAAKITKRLELAMGYRIFSPDYRYTAENYQIMNYGFGGSISLHLDASNEVSDNDISGGRLTTAMLYLSDVSSGGFTIFPKLGLFFKPESGSLLYWKLRRTDGSTDARMHHMGCPVLYGDKWIGNKWIRWNAQMDTFKCFLPKAENYPSNDQVVNTERW